MCGSTVSTGTDRFFIFVSVSLARRGSRFSNDSVRVSLHESERHAGGGPRKLRQKLVPFHQRAQLSFGDRVIAIGQWARPRFPAAFLIGARGLLDPPLEETIRQRGRDSSMFQTLVRRGQKGQKQPLRA